MCYSAGPLGSLGCQAMPSLGFSCYMTLAQRVKVPTWYMIGRHGDFKLGALGCTMDLAVRVPQSSNDSPTAPFTYIGHEYKTVG